MNASKRWPGYTEEAYPDIFTTIPPQPECLKPGQVQEDDVRRFFNEVSIGFLANIFVCLNLNAYIK